MAMKTTSTAKPASNAKKASVTKKTAAVQKDAGAVKKTSAAKPASASKKTSAAKPASAAKKTSAAKPASAAKKTSAAKPASAAKKTSAAKPASAAKKTSAAKPASAAKKTSAAKPASAAKKTSAEKPASAPEPVDAAPTAAKKAPPAEVPESPKSAPSGISIEEAKKIFEEVHAGRKKPKGPCRAALPLSFTKPRQPSTVDELNTLERRQLVAAGVDGMGEVRTPEGWLDEEDESYYGSLEIWDVLDAKGVPVYSLWMYLTDNGTVFRVGSIDIVGGVSQGGMECAEEGLEEALLDAKKRVSKDLLQRSLLRFID